MWHIDALLVWTRFKSRVCIPWEYMTFSVFHSSQSFKHSSDHEQVDFSCPSKVCLRVDMVFTVRSWEIVLVFRSICISVTKMKIKTFCHSLNLNAEFRYASAKTLKSFNLKFQLWFLVFIFCPEIKLACVPTMSIFRLEHIWDYGNSCLKSTHTWHAINVNNCNNIPAAFLVINRKKEWQTAYFKEIYVTWMKAKLKNLCGPHKILSCMHKLFLIMTVFLCIKLG